MHIRLAHLTMVMLLLVPSALPRTDNASKAKKGVVGATASSIVAAGSLEYFDVQCEQLSQQIIIKSSRTIKCKKQLSPEKHQLIVDITGLRLSGTDQEMISKKMDALKELGYIKDLAFGSDQPDATRFIFTFAPHRMVTDKENNEQAQVPNRFLIRSCSYAQSLTIDIFTEEALKKVIHKDSFIKLAANDVQRADYAPLAGSLKPLRILIDAGHGGSDKGAASHHGVLEKDITLDIGKRVHRELRDLGYQVYLTRYDDAELSLAQRTSIATQFQTDFVVSIHANSSGKPLSVANGIETFYFPAKELRNKERLDFMFVNHPADMSIIHQIQQNVHAMVNASYHLAKNIQDAVVSTVATQHKDVQNRGVKADFFRLFIKNRVPCALVEVGFMTNRQEAERLENKKYRKLLANGIVRGITSFVQAHKQLVQAAV